MRDIEEADYCAGRLINPGDCSKGPLKILVATRDTLRSRDRIRGNFAAVEQCPRDRSGTARRRSVFLVCFYPPKAIPARVRWSGVPNRASGDRFGASIGSRERSIKGDVVRWSRSVFVASRRQREIARVEMAPVKQARRGKYFELRRRIIARSSRFAYVRVQRLVGLRLSEPRRKAHAARSKRQSGSANRHRAAPRTFERDWPRHRSRLIA